MKIFVFFKLKLLWVSKEHILQLKDFSISRLEIMVTEIISSNFEFKGNLIGRLKGTSVISLTPATAAAIFPNADDHLGNFEENPSQYN